MRRVFAVFLGLLPVACLVSVDTAGLSGGGRGEAGGPLSPSPPPLDDAGAAGDSGGVPPGDAGGDADATVGPPPSDAGVIGVETGTGEAGPPNLPNLALNGDFEADCAGWAGAGATATASSIAHGGNKSCQVCSNSGNPSAAVIFQKKQITGPSSYMAQAWVRAPSTGPLLSPASIGLGVDQQNPTAGDGPVDLTWRLVTTLLVVDQPGTHALEIDIGLLDPSGAIDPSHCLLVDDVVVVEAPIPAAAPAAAR